MFSCASITKSAILQCPFKDVSPCYNQVSPYICNEHLQWFGLFAKRCDYTDGENNNTSRIEIYCTSYNSLRIPLFINPSGVYILDQINNFANEIKSKFNNVDTIKLCNALTCSVGLSNSRFLDNCLIGSWLNEPDVMLFVKDRNGELSTIDVKMLPNLHKILFWHVKPSCIRNRTTDSYTYSPHTLILKYEPSSDSYMFELENKSIVLKYTDNPDCVATPLVLCAIRYITKSKENIEYRPTASLFDDTC